jgi:UDP-N-acetylmuramoyl-tripeptide--D-alanyl-D-alanine ligase
MINILKKFLYFPVAYYFRIFAQIQLLFWQPRIIVITGSNGKTTLLHLIESQLGDQAKYSHQANSTYGIPFDILGLQRKTLTICEWPYLFLLAPFKAFRTPPKQKIYVVEADCDRPKEGKFLASLLKPEITIWLSVSKTHSVNFHSLNDIAFEFGFFLEYCKNYAIINGDNNLIIKQLPRTKATTDKIYKKNNLQKYQILQNATKFIINGQEYSFNFLLPEDTYYSIQTANLLLNYLNIPTGNLNNFTLPPGRSSLFSGIKNTTIIDSSYNATPASMEAALNMYKLFPVKNKWAIISDMVDLGKEEEIEHIKLAELIDSCKLDKVILMGPRVIKYTLPKLQGPTESFLTPREVLDFLNKNINGGEVLFFKGARFLEGIIEHLLNNKDDVNKLCRREKVWEDRRKQWGL